MQKAIIVAEARLTSKVKNTFIRLSFNSLTSNFLKSAAKLLLETAKTCQYVRKKRKKYEKMLFLFFFKVCLIDILYLVDVSWLSIRCFISIAKANAEA